jgi:hypothetical protein
VSKIIPVLATGGGLEQTGTHIMSRQYIGAAGAGAGASDDGKGMITEVVGQASCNRPASQQSASFFGSWKIVEIGTSFFVGPKKGINFLLKKWPIWYLT